MRAGLCGPRAGTRTFVPSRARDPKAAFPDAPGEGARSSTWNAAVSASEPAFRGVSGRNRVEGTSLGFRQRLRRSGNVRQGQWGEQGAPRETPHGREEGRTAPRGKVGWGVSGSLTLQPRASQPRPLGPMTAPSRPRPGSASLHVAVRPAFFVILPQTPAFSRECRGQSWWKGLAS